jgi:hypothetical protein
MLHAHPKLLVLTATAALAGAVSCARAQVAASVYSIDLGTIAAAGTGVTIVRFTPAGAVSVVSGAGGRVSGGAARFEVDIPCNANACANKNTNVEIGSTGTPTGRLGALGNFTVTMGAATLVSGPTGTNPIQFTLGPMGHSATATFFVGADAPVYGDDSSGPTGAASSAIYVTTTDWKGGNAATTGAALTAKVFRQISVSQTAPLSFGTIVRPAAGPGSMTLDPDTGGYSVTGGAILASPPPSRAAFMATGEGGQTVSISVPSSVVLTDGAGGALTIATSSSTAGSQTLSNALGSAGAYSFYVGGTLGFSSATASGVYSGTYAVDVAYN